MQSQILALQATPQLLNLGLGSWHRYAYEDRPYFVYTPTNYHVDTPVPLVLMLHGCSQVPIDIAYDSQMNQLADRQQFVVVYPQYTEPQPGDANPMLCWNFFYEENQHRGSGEPDRLANIVQAIVHNASHWTIDRQRIYVAGISSGGAMAAILGATYPDLFAAIGVHSGVEYQWAQLPHPAAQFCSNGTCDHEESPLKTILQSPSDTHVFFREGFLSMLPPGPDPIEQGRRAYEAMGPLARVVPTIVFHGTADPLFNPINGDQVAQQWLHTNQLASHGATFEHPSSVTVERVQGGRNYIVFRWQDAMGSDIIAYWKVDGMGHAWSGGSPGRPFTDPLGPNASVAMYQFFMAHSLS